MSEQLLSILKNRLEELTSQGDPEVRRNALKEVLQLYILNFIYHHPKYSAWVMYGGSALRIIHGLDRMSVDLDFEVPSPVTEKFLLSLKEDIERHFTDTYSAGADFLDIKITSTRGLTLKFHVESLRNRKKTISKLQSREDDGLHDRRTLFGSGTEHRPKVSGTRCYHG